MLRYLFLCIFLSVPSAALSDNDLDLLSQFGAMNTFTDEQVKASKKALSDADKFVARVNALVEKYKNLKVEADNERVALINSAQLSLARATQVRAALKDSCAVNGGEPCSHLKVASKKISNLNEIIKALQ